MNEEILEFLKDCVMAVEGDGPAWSSNHNEAGSDELALDWLGDRAANIIKLYYK